MQIKKKTQLKIELDQLDIVEAVRDYLLKHGQRISEAELDEIIFVKSPKDGLRASLNITEESGSEIEGELPTAEPIETAEETVESVRANLEAEEQPATQEAEVQPEEETEAPGEVHTSTEEDVMPSVDEIAAMQAPVEEEEEEALVATTPTTSRATLFQ